MLTLILLNLIVITAIQADIVDHNFVQHCGDFKAQQLLDIDMLLGKWYATELIYHDRDEIDINTFDNNCPILFLEEVTKDKKISGYHNYQENEKYRHYDQQNNQHNIMDNPEESVNWDELMEPLLKVWKEQKNLGVHDYRRTTTMRSNEDFDDFKKQVLHRLRLIWNGDAYGGRTEYSLRYNNSRPGFWMSFKSQSDATFNQQFIGTIQVLKAVRTQAVLTFCHISNKHDFYTVVISREPWVNRTDLNHLHHMLERKQLPIRHIQSMCMEYRNNSVKLYFNLHLHIISFLLYFFVIKH